MEKIVLMISQNNFPIGDAGAIRDYSFAKIYEELGYKPIIICSNRTNKIGLYKGIEFYSIHTDAKNVITQAIRYYKQKKLLIENIKILEKKYGIPALIHLYGVSNNLFRYIKKYAAEQRIQIIHDSVEWYSSCEFKHGIFDKAYIMNNILNTKIISKPIKVIAISSYLKNHFETRGITCERIPAIIDVSNDPVVSEKKGKVQLIYAGNPANKDYLHEMITGVLGLTEEEKQRVMFNIYGITQDQLNNLNSHKDLDSCIVVHGRVTREEVMRALKTSDFSLLLRPENERYSMAGFPTKTVEAMSNGVAMMCNLTSDLGIYLMDGENCIVIEECTSQAMTLAVRRAINMKRQEVVIMKKKAKQTAVQFFDYRVWISTVEKLLER